MSKLLTRDAILQAVDLPHEDVEVPEWGGVVRVRGLTGVERDKFETSIVIRKGNKTDVNTENMRAKLVALCVVDEEGKRVFSGGDIKLLGQKSAVALDRVFSVAQGLSGLQPEDIEELEKN